MLISEVARVARRQVEAVKPGGHMCNFLNAAMTLFLYVKEGSMAHSENYTKASVMQKTTSFWLNKSGRLSYAAIFFVISNDICSEYALTM